MPRHKRILEARAAAHDNGAVFMSHASAVDDGFRPWILGLGQAPPEEVARLQDSGDDQFRPISFGAPPPEAEPVKAPAQPVRDDLEAKRIVAQAREKAETILAEARQAVGQLQAQEQQRLEVLVAERARQVAEAVRHEQEDRFRAATEELLLSFRRAADEAIQEAVGQVAELAAAVTTKVSRCKVEADDEIVVEVVSEAMRRLSDYTQLRVMLNPDDQSTVAAHRDALLRQAGKLDGLEIIASDGIERGGCVLESDVGEVDARINSQLQVIWEQILGTQPLPKTA